MLIKKGLIHSEIGTYSLWTINVNKVQSTKLRKNTEKYPKLTRSSTDKTFIQILSTV